MHTAVCNARTMIFVMVMVGNGPPIASERSFCKQEETKQNFQKRIPPLSLPVLLCVLPLLLPFHPQVPVSPLVRAGAQRLCTIVLFSGQIWPEFSVFTTAIFLPLFQLQGTTKATGYLLYCIFLFFFFNYSYSLEMSCGGCGKALTDANTAGFVAMGKSWHKVCSIFFSHSCANTCDPLQSLR